MTGLAKWLTTQVDADATLADKVYGWWRAFGERGIADDSYAAILIADADPDTREYILHNNPARALAEVAFKRAILAGHAAALVTWREWEGTAVPGDGAGACIPLPSPRVMMRVSEARSRLDAFDGSLRAMAKIYKDQPGYAEATS